MSSNINSGRLAGSSQMESRQPATISIPSCSHNGLNPAMLSQFRVGMGASACIGSKAAAGVVALRRAVAPSEMTTIPTPRSGG